MTSRISVVLLTAVLLALSGCGGASDAGASDGGAGVVRPSAPTSSAPTSSAPTSSAPTSRTVDGVRQVTGVVERGVEAGCLVLTSGGTTYLLLGRTDELVVGQEVTVVGLPQPGLLSSCQQGSPLRVSRTLPAGAPT